jgi:hypothetical protein
VNVHGKQRRLTGQLTELVAELLLEFIGKVILRTEEDAPRLKSRKQLVNIPRLDRKRKQRRKLCK